MKPLTNSHPKSRESQLAFTRLDSIAVAVSTLVIVAAFSTALASPRTSSHKLVCFENMRRIAQANLMYAGDNGDALPYPGWGNMGAGSLRNWLFEFHPEAGNGAQHVIEGGLLWPYLQSRSIYLCPSQETNTAHFLARTVKESSYFMNGAVSHYSRGVGGENGRTYLLSQFASNAVAFWEADELAPYGFNDGANRPDERISTRHGVGIVGTFGGGAEFMAYEAYAAEAGVPGEYEPRKPGRFWCDPGSPTGDGRL